MPPHRPARTAAEQREVPDSPIAVIPLCFLLEPLRMLMLFNKSQEIAEIVLGPIDEPPLPPPDDEFTAWAALAHMGLIEKGSPRLNPELSREAQLEAAGKVLSPGELLYVESIAVPRRFRSLGRDQLIEMVRTALDYRDRMWAACWLCLTGHHLTPDWPFDELECECEDCVIEAYAASIGVTSKEDELGWERIDRSYDVGVIGRRISVCQLHYRHNGPALRAPMEGVAQHSPGWLQIVQVVPDIEQFRGSTSF
jgi:hypothetical protein